MDNQPEALRLAADMSGIFVSEEIHASKAQAIAAELRRLHAENERKSEAIQKLWKERDEAIAEIERLRADAARYKWVKSQALWRPNGANCVTWDVQMPEPDIRAGVLTESSVGDELDAAIDAAIKDPAQRGSAAWELYRHRAALKEQQ